MVKGATDITNCQDTVLEDEVQADVDFKVFWRNPERFADLFNGVCFGGKPIIDADCLLESDAEVSGVIDYVDARVSLQRARDVVKKSAYGLDFIILGIENQKTVDYTMPLRVMVYDGQNYLKQLKEKKDSKELVGAEKFRVAPVITLVLYYGKKPWDGPLWLSEMMDEMPIEMRSMVSDYKMNLVQVLLDGTKDFHNPDVKMIFEYSQAFMHKDETALAELNDKYSISLDVFYMIGKITDSTKLMEGIRMEGKKGEVHMCEYLEEIRNSGLRDGEKLGREAGEKIGILGAIDLMRELQYLDTVIEAKLVEKFCLSQDKAREYLCM